MEFFYDSEDRVTKINEEKSATARLETSFAYSGDVVSVTFPDGSQMVITKDLDNNLRSIVGPGISTFFEYGDPNNTYGLSHLVTNVRYNHDPTTGITHGEHKIYEYDPYARIRKVTWPGGFFKSFKPALLNAVVNGLSADYYSPAVPVNADGLVSEITTPEGTTVYENNSQGMITRMTDPLGRVISTDVTKPDENGDWNSETHNPDGSSEEKRYNFLNKPIRNSVIDESGAVLLTNTTEYNDPNFPDLLPTRFVNSLAPLPVDITYDEFRRTSTVFDGTNCTNYIYADNSNFSMPVEVKTFSGQCGGDLTNDYLYSYDPSSGKLLSIQDNLHDIETSRFAYNNPDFIDLVSSVTDAEGNTAYFEYDPVTGKRAGVKNPAGNFTCFDYYPDGLLRRVVYPLPTGSITDTCVGKDLSLYPNTFFDYDEARRLSKRSDSSAGFESWTWDLNGNVSTHTDRLGTVFTYYYDSAGRPLSEEALAPDGSGDFVSYFYDNMDRLSFVSNSNSRIGTSYDALGRPTAISTELIDIDEHSGSSTEWRDTLTYDYQPSESGLSVTVASEKIPGAAQREYDESGRLKSIQWGNQAFAFSHDEAGRRSALAFPNGIEAEYNYDSEHRLTGIVYKKSGSVLWGMTNMLYDNAGNRISAEEVENG
ncbi:MAG: hypothetical protein WC552_07740, partial [Candidatus Omnitrophota bacterium]